MPTVGEMIMRIAIGALLGGLVGLEALHYVMRSSDRHQMRIRRVHTRDYAGLFLTATRDLEGITLDKIEPVEE